MLKDWLITYRFNIVFFSFLEQSIRIRSQTHVKTGKNCPSDTKAPSAKQTYLSPLTAEDVYT